MKSLWIRSWYWRFSLLMCSCCSVMLPLLGRPRRKTVWISSPWTRVSCLRPKLSCFWVGISTPPLHMGERQSMSSVPDRKFHVLLLTRGVLTIQHKYPPIFRKYQIVPPNIFDDCYALLMYITFGTFNIHFQRKGEPQPQCTDGPNRPHSTQQN